MQDKKTILLKIGGSVITKKNLPTPQIQTKILLAIANSLAQSFDPEKFRLILIHGAGSFGHLLAKKYSLEKGTKDHPEKEPEALKTQKAVLELHQEVISALKKAGLPVQSFPTHTVVSNTGGLLSSISTKKIAFSLERNKVPVLYGDMVTDNEWGYSICSGDALAAKLAQDFSAHTVFFASDVEGIFTKDPHIFPEAEIIPVTSLTEILSGHIALDVSHNIDVTGGLKNKFSLFQNFPALKNIFLFNGLYPENFSSIFQEKPRVGTDIKVSG